MKSAMPCPPGVMPVMKLDHATGLRAGIVVPRGLREPISASFLKLGSRPISMSAPRIFGSRPSRPRTITFLSVDEPPPQDAMGRETPAAAALPASIRMKSRRSTPASFFGLRFTGVAPPFRASRVETNLSRNLFLNANSDQIPKALRSQKIRNPKTTLSTGIRMVKSSASRVPRRLPATAGSKALPKPYRLAM